MTESFILKWYKLVTPVHSLWLTRLRFWHLPRRTSFRVIDDQLCSLKLNRRTVEKTCGGSRGCFIFSCHATQGLSHWNELLLPGSNSQQEIIPYLWCMFTVKVDSLYLQLYRVKRVSTNPSCSAENIEPQQWATTGGAPDMRAFPR